MDAWREQALHCAEKERKAPGNLQPPWSLQLQVLNSFHLARPACSGGNEKWTLSPFLSKIIFPGYANPLMAAHSTDPLIKLIVRSRWHPRAPWSLQQRNGPPRVVSRIRLHAGYRFGGFQQGGGVCLLAQNSHTTRTLAPWHHAEHDLQPTSPQLRRPASLGNTAFPVTALCDERAVV